MKKPLPTSGEVAEVHGNCKKEILSHDEYDVASTATQCWINE